MTRMVDDEPPIKSHPASKEYRENWDSIFGETEPTDAVESDVACFDPPKPPSVPCDVCKAPEGEWCASWCSER